MGNFRRRLVENLSEKNIRSQMYEIYYLAILLPEIIIGGILTVYVYLYSEKDTRILLFCILIVVTGILISYIVISFFASHFSTRVNKLRSSMHSVSNEDYEMSDTLRGNDEIAAAYEELKKTAQLIKEKDSEVFQTKLDAERFATEQQMMEYKMLSSQINPHFLYNTLEALRMRAIAEKDRDVATGIKLLGKSLRYVLDNTGTVSVPLQQELDYIENYIRIIKFRFAERISYELKVEDDIDTKAYSILPLLLQPIVENSVSHGLEMVENGRLIITVSEGAEETIKVVIKDDGIGMNPGTLRGVRLKIDRLDQVPAHNIGLFNINKRIKLFYGDRYGIEIDSEENVGTCVTVTIPMRPI
ncbi:MAG: histidine kinase [Lachnospiraceae bacterium]|nr:histidine kinase [Lachnospiraceae bacterium]MBR4816034.1 histidine kinase [Lachnospiraceae bacterium]